MSLGQIAFGLAGIALGLRQIKQGVERVHAAGGVAPRSGRSSGRSMTDVTRDTAYGSVRMQTYKIKDLDDRIAHLRKLVEQGKRDPAVYVFAREAVNKRCGDKWCVPEKDNAAEARALFKAVRDRVRYTSDIAGIDSYQRPAHTLKFRSGDCDDVSILACSAAATLGLPCRFKVIRTKDSDTWNHVYAQIGFPRRSPTKWVSFDASVNMPFGWEAPSHMVAASRVFPT